MKKTKKTVIISLFTAIGVVLQITESALPQVTAVPGGKLGLANIISIIILHTFGPAYAILAALIRSILGSLIFGGAMSALYSVSGAVLSAVFMALSYKYFYGKLSFIGIGCIGATIHNITQVTVAAVILQSMAVFAYLPILLIISAISGSVTGYVAQLYLIHNERLNR